jgi:hypothetical protein
MSKSHEIFELRSLRHIAVRVEAYKAQMVSCSFTTTRNSAMSGMTASNLPVGCGVGVVTYTRSAQKRAMQH